MKRRIIKNAIQCNHCGEVIVSTPENELVTCRCGMCSVDGAHDYLRRLYSTKEDYTELSITEPPLGK